MVCQHPLRSTTMADTSHNMTAAELKAAWMAKRAAESREWQVEGYKMKLFIDRWVETTYGKRLQELNKKPADLYLCPNPNRTAKAGDTFKNPDTGEVWTFSGKGKLKNWVKGHEQEYRVK